MPSSFLTNSPYTNIQQYALRLLGLRDYSYFNLKKKILSKGWTDEEVEKDLKLITDKNWQSDSRYAAQIINGYKAYRGKFWLIQKLRTKGIPKDLIEQSLQENFDSTTQDYTLVKAKLERKYKIINWKLVDQKTLQKVIGFMGRSGIENSFSLIREWKHTQPSQEG
jgi:regulatory protein